MSESAASTPTRVVLDTNIALSLYAFKDSRFAAIREARDRGELIFLTNDECFKEFVRVLGYRQIRLEEQQRDGVAARYRNALEFVQPNLPDAASRPPVPKCRDRDDQKFLELANLGMAEVLISADAMVLGVARKPTFSKAFEIITPQKMMDKLATDLLRS
jgi:uncharacterized protein